MTGIKKLVVKVPGQTNSDPIKSAQEFSRLVRDVMPHLERIVEIHRRLEACDTKPASIIEVTLSGQTSVETAEILYDRGGQLIKEQYPIGELYKL